MNYIRYKLFRAQIADHSIKWKRCGIFWFFKIIYNFTHYCDNQKVLADFCQRKRIQVMRIFALSANVHGLSRMAVNMQSLIDVWSYSAGIELILSLFP